MKKILIYPAFLGLLQVSNFNIVEASTPSVESQTKSPKLSELKGLKSDQFKEKISELITSLESVLTGEFIDQITRNADIPFDMQLFVNEINSSQKLYVSQNAQGFSNIISSELKQEAEENKKFIDILNKNHNTKSSIHVVNLLSKENLKNVHHEFKKLLETRKRAEIPGEEIPMLPKEEVIEVLSRRNLLLGVLSKIDTCLEYAYLVNATMKTCETLQSTGKLESNVEINSSYLFWPHGASVSGMTFVGQKFGSQGRSENSVLVDLDKFREKLNSVKPSTGQGKRERINRFEAIQELGKGIEYFLNLIKDPLVRDIDQVINILNEHERKTPFFQKNDFEKYAIAKLTGYKGNIQVLKCLICQIELSLRRALFILAKPQNNMYKNELSQGFLNDAEIETLLKYLNFPQLKDGVEQIIKQLK